MEGSVRWLEKKIVEEYSGIYGKVKIAYSKEKIVELNDMRIRTLSGTAYRVEYNGELYEVKTAEVSKTYIEKNGSVVNVNRKFSQFWTTVARTNTKSKAKKIIEALIKYAI